MVLSEATLYIPEMVIMPETLTVCEGPEVSADFSAAALFTVTTVPDAPPLVPPFKLAKPTGLLSAAEALSWPAASSVPAARTVAETAEMTKGGGTYGWMISATAMPSVLLATCLIT